MPKKWTAEDDAELLRLILQMYVPRINYGEVAARLNNGATVDAVRHRVRKFKGTNSDATPVKAGKSKKGARKERESDGESDDGYQKVKKAKAEDI